MRRGDDVSQRDLTAEIADALSSLHDPVALRAHPLSRTHGPAALRAALVAAIEALRPASTVDPASRAWRPYQLLNLRYVEALDPTATARRPAISPRQF